MEILPGWGIFAALSAQDVGGNHTEIRRLNKSKVIQQPVHFLSSGDEECENFFMRLTVWFMGLKKCSCLLYFFTAYKMSRSNLQLSISRVQFCSSSGYLLRSIMQAAVVVILQQNENRREAHKSGDLVLNGVETDRHSWASQRGRSKSRVVDILQKR